MNWSGGQAIFARIKTGAMALSSIAHPGAENWACRLKSSMATGWGAAISQQYQTIWQELVNQALRRTNYAALLEK